MVWESSKNWLAYKDDRIDHEKNDLEVARDLLMTMKRLLFKFDSGQHHGIRTPNVPEKYRVAWDVLKVIKHQLWKDDPERYAHVVDADVPEPSCDQPLPTIKRLTNK